MRSLPINVAGLPTFAKSPRVFAKDWATWLYASPGLAAKDVIDIQITVAELDQSVLSAMLALGYSQPEGISHDHQPPGTVGPETEWRKWFFYAPLGQRRTNTHVRI